RYCRCADVAFPQDHPVAGEARRRGDLPRSAHSVDHPHQPGRNHLFGAADRRDAVKSRLRHPGHRPQRHRLPATPGQSAAHHRYAKPAARQYQLARSEALMRGEGPSPRALLWSIFVFALVVRLAVTAGTIGFSTPAAAEPASDSRIHMNLVQNLLNGHGFSYNGVPTAITPPLYIFFLAGLYTLFGHPAPVRVVQAVLGAASCVLLYATGRKMFNPTTGLIAAVLLSMSPVLVYIGGLHLTENLFLPLLLLFLWLSTYVAERPTTISIAGLGVLLGLAALTRAAFSAFLPFVLIWGVSLWGVRNPLAYRVY